MREVRCTVEVRQTISRLDACVKYLEETGAFTPCNAHCIPFGTEKPIYLQYVQCTVPLYLKGTVLPSVVHLKNKYASAARSTTADSEV